MARKAISWSLAATLFLVFSATLFLVGRFTERSLAKSRNCPPQINVSYQNGIITLVSNQRMTINFASGIHPGDETDFLTKLELERGYASRDLFEARQQMDRKRIKVVKVPPTRLVVLEGLTPHYR